ncbi:hypothetical protein FBU31_007898, partial [Coemansia sp. 'formosensis']
MSTHNNQSNRLRHQAGLRNGTPVSHSGYSSAAYSGAGPEDDGAQTYDDPNGKDSRLKAKISMLKD